MLDRREPPSARTLQRERWRDKKRRQRERLRDGQGIAPVPFDDAVVNLLVRLGALPAREAHTVAEIGAAIGRVIGETARSTSLKNFVPGGPQRA
jgi:hypothetical protein